MITIQSRFKTCFIALSCLLVVFISFSSPQLVFANINESVDDNLNEKDKNNDIEDTPAADTTPENAAVSVSAWDYIKMVLALLFVLALLYGVLKLVNSKNRLYQQHQLIQNLGGLSLGQHKSVQLLQVGDSLFLVGVGEDISILKEITNDEEKEKLTNFYTNKQEFTAQIPYISTLLKRFKDQFLSKKIEQPKNGSFEQLFRKRLSEIKTDRSDGLRDWKKKENDRQ